MLVVTVLILVPLLPLIILATAATAETETRSTDDFFIALLQIFAGIEFPLFIFLFSGFLVPEWQGGCKHGWIDCFMVGKLVLTPLVLWSCAAFYSQRVLAHPPGERAWVTVGLCTGSVVSMACFLFGCVFAWGAEPMRTWLLVPLYVSVWYTWESVLAVRASRGQRVPYHC
jgi:hypothetical protein